jgi:heme/copper-type cytochrome/quinol oxidase subunit 2
MCASFDKIKKADRKLKVIVIGYPLLGLMVLYLSLYLYLKHDLDWTLNKPVEIDTFQQFEKAVRILVYVLLPTLAVGYFLAAYYVWDYLRKRGDLNDYSKTETKSEMDSKS